jgi:hypothetical protein
MARVLASWLVAIGLLLAGTVPAAAETWAGVEPGVSTVSHVRARFGPPSRELRKKVDGFDTTEWIYEGNQAPAGFYRMSVEFGLVVQGVFSAGTVRVLRVDPKPHIFNQATVIAGWGSPDAFSEEGDRLSYFYRSGLVVIFDPSKMHAATMLFTPPQPAPAGATPGAPAPGGSAPGPSAPAPGPAPPRR